MTKTVSYRSVRKSHFTQISNNLLNDSSIPLESKGLLSIFLSNTEEWDLHMREIIKRSKNGRDAHYKALNKLIKAGYIARLEFKQVKSNQFVQQEYIFSDNPEDVIKGIENAKIMAHENQQFIVLTYQDKENFKLEFLNENSTIEPFTENPDTEEMPSVEPFTENPDTEKPDTDFADSENQYTNNTNINKTNINNSKDNDMNDMNDRYSNISNTHSNHSNQNTQLDEEALKHYELQEYPEHLAGYLMNFDYKNLKLVTDTIKKAKANFNKNHATGTFFTLEDTEQELINVLKRFKAVVIKRNETIASMQAYLFQSVRDEYIELQSYRNRLGFD